MNGLIELCRHDLRALDDDWIKAGMELGLITDAVVFGVHDQTDARRAGVGPLTDHTGQTHRFFALRLPRSELMHQGRLSDLAYATEYRDIWEALNWDSGAGGFAFRQTDQALFLTLDLDCFAVSWRDYLFPWPGQVYAGCRLDRRGWCTVLTPRRK